MKKTLSIILMTVTAMSAVASEKWSLDSCINYAVENNLTVKNREIERLSSELDIIEAKDQFLPQLSASASQSFNFGRGLTSENTYANRNTSNFQWGTSVQLPLFQGLSAVRQLKLSKINLRSMILQVEAAKDNITLNVISQYLQVLYSSELLATAQNQLELSRYELTRQETLLEAGRIPEIDVIQQRAQVAQDQQAVTESENNLTIAKLDLIQLLQLPELDGFDIEPLAESEPLIRPAEDVYRDAMVSNHSVLAARNNIEAAQASISVAKTGYIPRLSFNAGIGSSYYNLSGVENPSFSRQMRDNLNKYFGFSLSVPIFDAFSTRNRVRKAKLQETTARLQLQDTETTLYKEIQQAYYRAKGAREKYLTGISTEEASRLAFEAMKEKYEMGRSNPTEFEQSKNAYLKTTIDRIQSHYEYILRCRILDFYAHGD